MTVEIAGWRLGWWLVVDACAEAGEARWCVFIWQMSNLALNYDYTHLNITRNQITFHVGKL